MFEIPIVIVLAILIWSHVMGKNDIERLIHTIKLYEKAINSQGEAIHKLSKKIYELEKMQGRDGFE